MSGSNEPDPQVATERVLVECTSAGEHQALLPHLRDLPPDAPVLDLGCGTSAWIERLAEAGFTDLTGVDADGTHFGARRASLVVADLNCDELDLPKAHYALITAIEVLEHLENPDHFAGLIKRHLAPGGICLITTPNVHSLSCRLRYFLTGRLPAFDRKGEPTHINAVVVTCLERVLAAHKLEICARWTYPERRTRTFGLPVRVASAVVRMVLADPLPGDTLCLLIGHAPPSG
jgi:2-polyprenyl-3-methyl-5-hydroxy-6-metoxy-1,4-benzoquinol methylase